MTRLPTHLRFLEDLASAEPDRLSEHYPQTAAGTLVPRPHEALFDAGGLSYIGPKDGRMVPIAADNAEPMEENWWYDRKFAALVLAIEAGEHPIVLPGFAHLWAEGRQLKAQVRDGHHRSFAPFAAGASWTWVLMSDETRQDLDRREGDSPNKLYRLIRASQRAAGTPLFVRRRQSRVAESKRAELLATERAAADLRSAIADYHRAMLKKHGPASSGFSLDEQQQRPELFWRMRLRELSETHGDDWVYDHIDDSKAALVKFELQQQLSATLEELYDLRKAAGLAHGERLDPETGLVIR